VSGWILVPPLLAKSAFFSATGGLDDLASFLWAKYNSKVTALELCARRLLGIEPNPLPALCCVI
jgi:hypothetical protein